MNTVIYMSTKNIKILRGRMRKKGFQTARQVILDTPPDTISNGFVVNEEPLLEALSGIKKDFRLKTASLVLDSTRITLKTSILPKSSEKQMAEIVKNEFADKNLSGDEYFFDYKIIRKNFPKPQQNLVFCCAVDKSLMESYVQLFKKAGVKLLRVDIAANSVINMTKYFKAFNRDGSIVCVIDHSVVSIIHFMKDGQLFLNRSRIVATEKDAQYCDEVVDKISSFLQFRKSVDGSISDERIYIIDSNAVPEGYGEALRNAGITNNYTAGIQDALKNDCTLNMQPDLYIYNLGMIV